MVPETVFDITQDRCESNSPLVFHLLENDCAEKAAQSLRSWRVRAAVVLDKHDRLCGIISEGDMSRKVVAENKIPSKTKVSEIMSVTLLIVFPHTSLGACSRSMLSHDIRHLIVVKYDPAIIPMGALESESVLPKFLEYKFNPQKTNARLGRDIMLKDLLGLISVKDLNKAEAERRMHELTEARDACEYLSNYIFGSGG